MKKGTPDMRGSQYDLGSKSETSVESLRRLAGPSEVQPPTQPTVAEAAGQVAAHSTLEVVNGQAAHVTDLQLPAAS